jgi:hypothetical protein
MHEHCNEFFDAHMLQLGCQYVPTEEDAQDSGSLHVVGSTRSLNKGRVRFVFRLIHLHLIHKFILKDVHWGLWKNGCIPTSMWRKIPYEDPP